MKTKTALLTALAALISTAAIGCGGSSPGGSFHAKTSGPPAPEAAQDYHSYDQPGADSDALSASSGGAARAPSAAPPPSSPNGGFDDRGRAEQAPRRDSDPFEMQRRQEHRPGLATRWGEQRNSRVTSAPFVRANRNSPFSMAQLFYNDAQGIAAMADGGSRQHRRRFTIAGGHLEVALRDGSGRFMSGFKVGADNYVAANSGSRYTIVIQNHSPGRIEAVVSVDGLDVIDGKGASPSKRGYLLDPFGDLEIEGFRTSTSQVAAFRFGSVGQSYASKKHGDTRNVGVIGVAVFHERGDSPSRWGNPRNRGDATKRHNAQAFPQFATP